MSETKLAIDDLYERIKDQNGKRIVKGDEELEMKTWIEKLNAIQFRILDLEDITFKFEQESKKVVLKK
jgi:hypothetical protein